MTLAASKHLAFFFFLVLSAPFAYAQEQEKEKEKPAPSIPSPPKVIKEKRPVNDSLYLKRGQVFFGGRASLNTSAAHARRGSSYPDQSRITFDFEPSVGLMLNSASSIGLATQLYLQNRDDVLPPIYPQGSRLRQRTTRYILGPNFALYQAALKRLYVKEQVGIGPSVGRIKAIITDSSGREIESRSFVLRGVEANASVGFLYFVRREIAIDAALTYRLSWDKVTTSNQPVSSLDVWLPTGRYVTSGVHLQVGFTVFIN